ncbi:MAG: hypothetical protein LBL94_04965 [Prevotellaceae bacterium]|jgi:hypothetical protein|nr:hypothetical protein [Prevotellaceae bacterium]
MKEKMETKKPTSKQEEIAALRALVAMDGYFADTFRDDLEKMCQNIITDFNILAGTHVNEEILQLEERAAELEESHERKLFEIADRIIHFHEHHSSDCRVYDIAVSAIGRTGVIRRKRELGLDISNDEADYLLNKLNR